MLRGKEVSIVCKHGHPSLSCTTAGSRQKTRASSRVTENDKWRHGVAVTETHHCCLVGEMVGERQKTSSHRKKAWSLVCSPWRSRRYGLEGDLDFQEEK